jgi:catechol 2,3-dioxygenase-like lactoylglutathione lyase family enzyme
MGVHKLFHVAINSTDLDRSVAFYKKLGFQLIADRQVNNPNLLKAFGVESHDLRFVHLRLGDTEDATLLDIVQWYNPDTYDADPPRSQMQRGLTRFAVLTDDTDATYRGLKAAGVKTLTEPQTMMTPQGGWRICLVEDPDGVVVQITELKQPEVT